MPHPLRAGYLKVRPLSLAEQFCAAGRIVGADTMHLRTAATITPWARLFQNEPAYVLAQIISFHSGDAAKSFERALQEEPDKALEQIGALARMLDNWLTRIQRSGLTDFSKQIAELNAEGRLTERIASFAKGQARYVRQAVLAAGMVPRAANKRNALQEAIAMDTGFRSAHALLRNSIVTLQPIASEAFERRIASGDIDPALGLLLSELAASGLVDEQLNAFVSRITRHYYEDVIGQSLAGPSEERILLHLPKPRRRSLLPKNALLQARGADGVLQRFKTEADVPVSTAKLIGSAILSYETDPAISFNAALGGITGVRAKQFPAGSRTRPEPVFLPATSGEVDMGLDVSSTMFAMSEGDRVIEVSLNMRRGSNLPAASDFIPWKQRQKQARGEYDLDPDLLMALRSDPELIHAFGFDDFDKGVEKIAQKVHARAVLDKSTVSLMLVYEVLTYYVLDINALRTLLGRIVTLCLIEKQPLPGARFWAILRKKIDACRGILGAQQTAKQAAMRRAGTLDGKKLPRETMIFEAFETDEDDNFLLQPEDIFEKLLSDAFQVTLSTAEGPMAAAVTQVLCNFQKGIGGITIKLSLTDAMPPIVGPAANEAPVMSIRYAPDARICPVSFFERYHIPNILIRVRATGMTALRGFADDGPLSTDQAFMPFGARPKDGATFWIGSPELAVKPVTDVGVDITWAELPGEGTGFDAHYAHYPTRKSVPDPKVDMKYLSRDGWKPVTSGPVPLFHSETVGGMMLHDWGYAGPLFGQTVPAYGLPGDQSFASRQTVRAGVISMTISDTGGGFLVDDYPLALVKAVRPQRLPEKIAGARPVPRTPFVPRVASMSLSYIARTTIELNSPKTARTGEQVVQVGPFGRIEVFPQRALRRVRLFPERLGYGHLFIQIGGSDATGPLTLVFDAANNGHLRRIPEPNPITWHYLTQSGWTPLPPSAVSSDSTAGLMRSGLVALDLPDDAIHNRGEMPPGGVWLAAVATKPRLEAFPKLARIDINGVWALRDGEELSPPEGREWIFDPPQDGVGGPREIPTHIDVRPKETFGSFAARIGERLRHRKRAVTPWDFERLVLEAFPDVWMVRCLPHLDQKTKGPAPGHVTVVLVRKPPKTGPNNIVGAHLFDVGSLSRVKDYLTSLSSRFSKIDVVNPSFQRIQVRATLRFDAFRDDGAMAQRLSKDLDNYLSVWTGPPEVSRFGWSINRQLLRAHINALEYVRGISNFSVLHLSQDDTGHHALIDTAQDDYRRPKKPGYIRPANAWSLPIAAANHALQTAISNETDRETQSGIGRLSVGDMLIVGQKVNT
ncbi:MAG: hypothetical protein AB8B58_03240 [Roseobacter sp.]